MKIFFLLIFFSFYFSSCFTNYQFSDGSSINKRKIRSEVKSVEKNNFYNSNTYGHKLKISKVSLESKPDNEPRYSRINELEKGKLVEGWGNRKPYFIQKIGNGTTTYYKGDQINIFKPQSLNKELFFTEVNKIVMLLENGNLKMKDIDANLDPDIGLSVQYFGEGDWETEDAFVPEVKEVLIKGTKNEIFKSELVELPQVSYLSLVQNIGKQKSVETVTYFYILLK